MASNNTVTNLANLDKISNLPDDILSHILSFLPTKTSVLTRILSTRWKNLFTLVPILDIEFDSLTKTSVDSITDFLYLFFISYNVRRMTKFRFHFSNGDYPFEPRNIYLWIYFVVHLLHVQEIDISAPSIVPMILPRDLFSCKTLIKLKLWGDFYVVLPHEVCLPCLRICELGLVYFKCESARRLFKSCPSLERLDLTNCHMEGGEVLNISSSTLKYFEICVRKGNYQLVLNIPNLEYFVYQGKVGIEFVGLETLKSVVDVTLNYEQCLDMKDDVSVELVRAICQVSELCLYCGPMEAFVRSGQSWPKFSNLTRLILGPISSFSSRLLASVLDNSPRLEFLSFSQGTEDEGDQDWDDQESYLLPYHVPKCVSLHLKEVELRSFSMLGYDL